MLWLKGRPHDTNQTEHFVTGTPDPLFAYQCYANDPEPVNGCGEYQTRVALKSSGHVSSGLRNE